MPQISGGGTLKDPTAFNSANSGLNSTKNSSTGNALSNVVEGGIFVSPEILTGTILGQNLKVAPSEDNSTSAGLVHDDDDIISSGLINSSDDLNFVATSTTQTITENIALTQNTTISQTWEYPDQNEATTYTFDLAGFDLVADSSLQNGLMFSIGRNVTLEIKNSSSTVSNVYSGVPIQMFQISGHLIVNATNSNIVFDGKSQSSRIFILASKLKNSAYSDPSAILNGCVVQQFYSHAIQVNAGSELVLNGATIKNNKGTASILSYDSASSTDYNPPIVTINAGTEFDNNLRGSINSDLYVKGNCTLTIDKDVSLAKRVPTKVIKNQENYTYTEDTVEEYVDIFTQGSLTTTIDLNGFTISNIGDSKSSTFDISGSVIIKNGNIKLNNNAFTFITDASGADITIKDIKVTSKNENGSLSYSGFYVSSINKTAIFENVEIDGGYTAQISVYGTNLIFKGCTFKDMQTSGGVITCNNTESTIKIDEATVFENNLKKNTDKRIDIAINNNATATLDIADGVSVYIDDCKSIVDLNTIIEPNTTTQTVEYGKGGFIPKGTDGNGNIITDNYIVKYRASGKSGEWSTAVPTTLGTYDVYLYREKTSINSTLSRVMSGAFVVEPQKVAVPTLSATTFTYNGGVQKPTLSEYELSILTATFENPLSTNAGSYKITFTLADKTNYCWADGTITDKEIGYKIDKEKVAPPTINSKVYTGGILIADIPTSDLYKVLRNNGGDNAGSYSVYLELNDKANYGWSTRTNSADAPYDENSTLDDYIDAGYDDQDFLSLGIARLTFTITKATTNNITISCSDFTYGSYTESNKITASADFGIPIVVIKDSGGTVITDISKVNAGTYTITATTEGTDNYVSGTQTATITIAKVKLAKPTVSIKTFTYDGNLKTLDLTGFNTNTMTKSGDGNTNAGSYTATISLKDKTNYQWADGNTTDVEISWSIEKATIKVPTISNLTFNNTLQKPTFSDERFTVTENAGGTNVGGYSVKLKLTDTIYANYKWETSDNQEITLTYQIEKFTSNAITNLTIEGWTFGDTTKTPSVNVNFGKDTIKYYYVNRGETSYTEENLTAPTNAGKYTLIAVVEGNNNYNGDTKSVDFEIAKASVTVPTLTQNLFVYTGSAITPEVTNGTQTGMTVGGTTSATNVGNYTITFTLDDNHKWATTFAGSLTWSITQKEIIIPTVSGTYTYNKTSQTLVLDNYDESIMSITGNTETNAGTYTAVVVLTNSNYKWKTDFDGNISWSIGQATNSFTQTIVTGWSGDEEPKVPTITAKFGEVVLTYKAVRSDIETENIPTAVGSYKVIARVTETTNYTGLEQEFDLSITSKSNSITGLTITGWSYGNYNAETNKPSATAKEGTIKYYYVGVGDTSYAHSETAPTDAGTYKVLAIVDGTSEYAGASAEKEFTIEKAEVGESDKPTIVGSYTYNQTTQNVQTTTPHSYMTLGGSLSGENAGDYTITITLDNNHKWAEGVSNTIVWTIQKAQAQITDLTITDWTYGSVSVRPSVNVNFGRDTIKYYYVARGETTYAEENLTIPTNAGEYTLIAVVEGTGNYDGDTSEGVTFTIAPKTVTAPSENTNTFTYTGSNQTYLENGTDYTVENGTKTDAGSYNVTVTLNDKANFVWSTGGTEDITFTFIINKAEFSVPSAEAKPFTGETLKSDLVDTTDYTVTQNDGGTEIGKYDVKLKLTEEKFKNYKWKGYSENVQEITIKFEITGTTNSWKIDPSIANFEYGSFNETVNDPKGEALFGGKATFEFFLAVDGEKTGKSLTLEEIKTADAGNYIMVATVPANEGVYAELRKEVPFTILKKKLTAPTKIDKTYTYIKNTTQTLELDTNFDENIMEIAGNTGTNAGSSYKAIITIKEAHQKNYEWKNGETQVEISWEILKQKLTIPTKNTSQDLTYTGNEITLELDNFDRGLMEIAGNIATNVHSTGYTATVTLKDTANYEWNGEFDGNIEWNIQKAQAQITDLTITDWTYNKTNANAVSPTAETNFGTIEYYYVGINGTTYAESLSVPTNAGKYKVIAKVSGSDNWKGAEDKTQEFTISPFAVAKPTADTTNFVYNGNEQTYTLATSEYYTISGDITKTNAGSSTITVSLNNVGGQINYVWDDITSSNLTYSFKIAQKTVTAPSENATTFVYNGNEQTYLESTTDYTVSGGKRTNAGSQDVTISLIDKVNTIWSTGGTGDVTYTFTIQKAEVKVAETAQEITEGETGSFSVGTIPTEVTITIKYAPTGTENWSENVPLAVGSYDVKLVFTASSESVNYKSSEQVIRTGFVVKQKAIAPVDDKEPTMVEKEKHAVQIGLIVSAVSGGLIVLTIVITAMRHHYLKKDCDQIIKDYYIEHSDEIPEDLQNKEDKKKKKKTKTNK